MVVVDADLDRGPLLVFVWDDGQFVFEAGDSAVPHRCKNKFLAAKQRGLSVDVFDLLTQENKERIVLAGFPDTGPCPTEASFKAARQKAQADLLARYGLDLDRKERP